EAVAYPRPGEVVYRGIVLRHDEPRGKGLAEIARADLVRMVRADHELTVQAENLTLRAEGPKQALAQVGSFIQRSGVLPYQRINVSAPNCRLDLGQEDLEFSVQEVVGEFVADHTNPMLRVAYRLAELGTGTHCELILNRDRSINPVPMTLMLKTREGP